MINNKRKEIGNLNLELYNQHHSINKTKLKLIKLNDYIPFSHEQSLKKNNNSLLSRLKNMHNNNFINTNSLLSKQYLSTDNNNIGRFIWNHQRYYGKINSDNLYNKLNVYNHYYDNNLIQSKSNVNILERKLNNKKRTKYNYSGNNFDDYRSFHINSKFNNNNIFSNNMNI